MRITEELKARIERGLSQKYEAEYKKNEEEYRAAVAKEKPAIIAELEKILSGSEITIQFSDDESAGKQPEE